MSFVNYIMSKIPWVEFYRPKELNNIVLDVYNKKILENIVETGCFPNLLLHGPPGTGKTTTIINLIDAYQHKCYNTSYKELITHLNASDERGVDIIRNQIYNFVQSKCLFNKGMKFVILDEVDYMTKNAQQSLKHMIENNTNNVRFCLICNYISKIYDGLQNEFVKLRFNQLPKENIIRFLNEILTKEQIQLDDDKLLGVQQMFGSDIRSMVNFLQTNLSIINNDIQIINETTIIAILSKIKQTQPQLLTPYFYKISIKYNINYKHIIKIILNYVVRNNSIKKSPEFFDFVESLMHAQNLNNKAFLDYAVINLKRLICLSD